MSIWPGKLAFAWRVLIWRAFVWHQPGDHGPGEQPASEVGSGWSAIYYASFAENLTWCGVLLIRKTSLLLPAINYLLWFCSPPLTLVASRNARKTREESRRRIAKKTRGEEQQRSLVKKSRN